MIHLHKYQTGQSNSARGTCFVRQWVRVNGRLMPNPNLYPSMVHFNPNPNETGYCWRNEAGQTAASAARAALSVPCLTRVGARASHGDRSNASVNKMHHKLKINMHQVKHIRIRFSYVLPIPPVCICLPMYIFSHVLLCVCVYLSPCVFALCVCPPMCVCFPVHVSPPNVYMSPCAYCPQVFSTEVFVPMHVFVLIYALHMSLSLCAYTSSQAYVSPHVYILHAYFPVFPLCMCPHVCVPVQASLSMHPL